MRLYRKKKKFVLWGKRRKERKKTKGRDSIGKRRNLSFGEKKERKKEYNKLKEGKC